MAFKSRDLTVKLSGAGEHGGGGGDCTDCTKCTSTHKDCTDCTKCTSTHRDDHDKCTPTQTGPGTEHEHRHTLADPALASLRLQLREALGGEAR